MAKCPVGMGAVEWRAGGSDYSVKRPRKLQHANAPATGTGDAAGRREIEHAESDECNPRRWHSTSFPVPFNAQPRGLATRAPVTTCIPVQVCGRGQG